MGTFVSPLWTIFWDFSAHWGEPLLEGALFGARARFPPRRARPAILLDIDDDEHEEAHKDDEDNEAEDDEGDADEDEDGDEFEDEKG